MTEQTEGAEVETLAELLSWATGEFTQWFDDAHPDHNRWSWRGDGHGAPTDSNPIRDDLRAAAQRILASDWLAAREAAAEVRGAQAVLAAVEAELTGEEERLAPYGPDASGLLDNWLGGIRVARDAARAAAAAAGGGA